MAWTAPRTWEPNELVTADMMNLHVRDNLLALKDPPTGIATSVGGSTTSTTFVDINSSALSFTLNPTQGGRLLIGMFGTFFTYPGDATIYLDFLIDSARVGHATNGIMARVNEGVIAICYLTNVISAASHTIKPQFRTSDGASPVNITFDQFWVREVS